MGVVVPELSLLLGDGEGDGEDAVHEPGHLWLDQLVERRVIDDGLEAGEVLDGELVVEEDGLRESGAARVPDGRRPAASGRRKRSRARSRGSSDGSRGASCL